jgi:hypothetical protein
LPRQLISDGEDLVGSVLSGLTEGLVGISSSGEISFVGGPLGPINGILDKFGLDFNDLVSQFSDKYDSFKSDILNGSLERQELFNLRPISLPRFPSILQIGSRKPSVQYSQKLKAKLWNKLALSFPSTTFNGVKIPNIPVGETFATTFPGGDFPGER